MVSFIYDSTVFFFIQKFLYTTHTAGIFILIQCNKRVILIIGSFSYIGFYTVSEFICISGVGPRLLQPPVLKLIQLLSKDHKS